MFDPRQFDDPTARLGALGITRTTGADNALTALRELTRLAHQTIPVPDPHSPAEELEGALLAIA